MRKFGKQLLAGPYLVWIIGFIILPVFAVLYYALTNSAGSFTMENIAAIAEPVHLKALFLALKLAVICTLICLLLSYPLAMILNNMKIKEHSFVVFLFVLPMWMNFMLRILAWQMLLSNNGIINSLLKTLGFSGINLMNTPTAVVFGMVYDYLPFMILPIYNALVRIRKDLIEAARDLGAGNLLVFFKIILPLSLSGVFSGIIMVFVPALTSFVISDLLGGGKVLLIGNVIEQSFMQGMDWHLGSGLSIVLMIFVIASMAFMNRRKLRRKCRMVKKGIERLYLIIIFLFLYLPIVVLIVLSFNDSKSRVQWGGFTLRWYQEVFKSRTIMNAFYTTITITLVASIVATLLGTLAAIGIHSMKRRQKALMLGATNIPLLNADIVTGISLMLLLIKFTRLGMNTVLIAHITFNIPYVILNVLPKLNSLSPNTYEAALDLGASRPYAFWKIIWPDIKGGVFSGFLMSVTMSLDDFSITYFTKGPGVNTLSTMIYTELKKGIKPEMYALSTILFLIALLLLLLMNYRSSKKSTALTT